MGFWSSLGKVLAVGGGIAAAPFTGGASLLPALIGAGANIAGAAIGAHGQSQASQAQTDASNKALEFERAAYERKLGDLNPYRNLGVSATSALANGLGLPNPSPVAPPGSPLVTGQPPQNIPIANPGPPGSAPPIGSTVKMRSPNGTIRDVPISEVGRLMQVGGVRVD